MLHSIQSNINSIYLSSDIFKLNIFNLKYIFIKFYQKLWSSIQQQFDQKNFSYQNKIYLKSEVKTKLRFYFISKFH